MKKLYALLSIILFEVAPHIAVGGDDRDHAYDENAKIVHQLPSRFPQCVVLTNHTPVEENVWLVHAYATRGKNSLAIHFKVLTSKDDYQKFMQGDHRDIQTHTHGLAYDFSMEGHNAAHAIFAKDAVMSLNLQDKLSSFYVPYSFECSMRLWSHVKGIRDVTLTYPFFQDNQPVSVNFEFPQVLLIGCDAQSNIILAPNEP